MSRLRSLLLSLGAIVGSLCVLVAIGGVVAGVNPLVFRSGSMGPDIPAGALGFSRPVPATDLAVGDVVSVLTSDRTRVTHRIVDIAGTGETRSLTLQGDANGTPDTETYQVGRTDRLFWSVPLLGYAVAWLGSPLGLFLLGGVVLGLLAVIFKRRPQGGKRRATALMAAPVAVAVVVASTTGTAAAFTDTAPTSSGTLTAHTVISQAAPVCSNEGGILGLLGYSELTWSHVDTRYEYAYTATRVSTGAVVATGTITPAGPANSSVTLDITAALLSLTLGNVDFDVTIRSRLTQTSSWVAATATVSRVHSVNLLVGLSVRCGPA
ncbi:signal peptidase I [Nocardioides daeguensis]|uniref:Signal peptidase I n=1 Tax=Nocardioides daeguensis TaxID=908359 RepID=A0ABP6VXS3_9ACTN|nr:signal peptidase I [Nocardioides daeguensis]MBV6726862.1 signal peptidase I [Nocardioides daeguensis]MCR1774386.1 signal peptidase I [Nocardioides daeguensis]